MKAHEIAAALREGGRLVNYGTEWVLGVDHSSAPIPVNGIEVLKLESSGTAVVKVRSETFAEVLLT